MSTNVWGVNNASSGMVPDWMSAEHSTGVSDVYLILFCSNFCYPRLQIKL